MLLGCECKSPWYLVKEMAVVRVTSDVYVFMVGWPCFVFFNFFLYSIVALWKKLIFLVKFYPFGLVFSLLNTMSQSCFA